MFIRIFLILCLPSSLTIYFLFWNGLENLVVYQDIAIVLVALYSAFLSFKVSRKYDPQDEIKQCWFLFGIGVLFYAIGESFYIWYEEFQGVQDAFPNFGDGLIVVGYLAFFRSYWKVLHNSQKSSLFPPNHRLKLSMVVIALFYLLIAIVMIGPALLAEKESIWKVLAIQIYPILDMIEFAFCIRILFLFSFFGNAKIAQPWMILCSSSVLSLLTDLAYSYFSFEDNYYIYFWVNMFFVVVYGLMGLAFQKQIELLDSINRDYSSYEDCNALAD